MPTLNVTTSSTDDLVNLDTGRALKALIALTVQEINTLRQALNLPALTATQVKTALIQAYKDA